MHVRRAAAAGLALAASVCSVTLDAQAFCRTTTCNPKTETCPRDSRGCVTSGLPLYWPERCISFGVQQDGSELRGITYEVADQVIQQAYRQWLGTECDGGEHPSFDIWDTGAQYGPIVCDRTEFNETAPNANVWMFRDDAWPYSGARSTLALTTITFEVPTGEILDADVEINSRSVLLSTGADVVNDLQSIATHETGHFLGLAHSDVSVATMYANYSPGDVSFRSLHSDDIAGICEIYPPDRDVLDCSAPRPRHGFSKYCAENVENDGCSVTNAPTESDGRFATAFAVALAALGAASRGLRHRAQPKA